MILGADIKRMLKKKTPHNSHLHAAEIRRHNIMTMSGLYHPPVRQLSLSPPTTRRTMLDWQRHSVRAEPMASRPRPSTPKTRLNSHLMRMTSQYPPGPAALGTPDKRLNSYLRKRTSGFPPGPAALSAPDKRLNSYLKKRTSGFPPAALGTPDKRLNSYLRKRTSGFPPGPAALGAPDSYPKTSRYPPRPAALGAPDNGLHLAKGGLNDQMRDASATSSLGQWTISVVYKTRGEALRKNVDRHIYTGAMSL
jgi:hypothetical protein